MTRTGFEAIAAAPMGIKIPVTEHIPVPSDQDFSTVLRSLMILKNRITIIPGATNDRDVIKRAISGCDGVLSVLVPWGVQQYSSGTAQAVMDFS